MLRPSPCGYNSNFWIFHYDWRHGRAFTPAGIAGRIKHRFPGVPR